MLEEALRKNPQERELQDQLHNARDLSQFISKVAGEASDLEGAQQYDQAIGEMGSTALGLPALSQSRGHHQAGSGSTGGGRTATPGRVGSKKIESAFEDVRLARGIGADPAGNSGVSPGIRTCWNCRRELKLAFGCGQKRKRCSRKDGSRLPISGGSRGRPSWPGRAQLAARDVFIRDQAVSELLQAFPTRNGYEMARRRNDSAPAFGDRPPLPRG